MQCQVSTPLTNALAAIALAGMTIAAVPIPAVAAGTQVNGSAAATQRPDTAIRSATSKVLDRIQAARDHLAEGNPDGANADLTDALVRIDAAEAALPMTMIHDQIATARAHVEQGDMRAAKADLAPIQLSLRRLTQDIPVQEAEEHVESARTEIEKDEKDAAMADFDAAMLALVYKEVVLPLDAARDLVTQAQTDIRNGDTGEAFEALKAAEDNILYMADAEQAPLAEAHRSFWQAARDYAVGAYDAAKNDVDRGLGFITDATDSIDEGSREAARKVSAEAHVAKEKVEALAEDTPSELEKLWRRTKAASERAAADVATGWERLDVRSDFAEDLAEAKLHLTYADIERFTARDPAQAQEELRAAVGYLNEAIPAAPATEVGQIRPLRDAIDMMASEPESLQTRRAYAELERTLAQILHGAEHSATGGITWHRADLPGVPNTFDQPVP